MSADHKMAEKRRNSTEVEDMDDDYSQARSTSPKSGPVDQEKRMRREIANSNERRRMQSINAGFQSLKAIIPHQEGEKLSKAAILHLASDYISSLEQERNQANAQNSQLRKRLKELAPHEGDGISPPPKRKKRDTESSDEGISMHFDDGTDLNELRLLLHREKHKVSMLEERIRTLEPLMHPDNPRHAAPRVAVPAIIEEKMEIERKVEPQVPQPSPTVANPVAPVTSAKLPPVAAPMPVSAPQDIPIKTETPAVPAFQSPQSRRNLYMIAEAIRHLEGENFDRNESHGFRSDMGSEESQTESSASDQEDSKSESSGRGSPVTVMPTRDYVPVGGLERQTATLHVSTPAHMLATGPIVGPVQMLQTMYHGYMGQTS